MGMVTFIVQRQKGQTTAQPEKVVPTPPSAQPAPAVDAVTPAATPAAKPKVEEVKEEQKTEEPKEEVKPEESKPKLRVRKDN